MLVLSDKTQTCVFVITEEFSASGVFNLLTPLEVTETPSFNLIRVGHRVTLEPFHPASTIEQLPSVSHPKSLLQKIDGSLIVETQIRHVPDDLTLEADSRRSCRTICVRSNVISIDNLEVTNFARHGDLPSRRFLFSGFSISFPCITSQKGLEEGLLCSSENLVPVHNSCLRERFCPSPD